MFKKIEDLLGITKRRAEKQRQLALLGQASSGNLNPGERDRLMRQESMKREGEKEYRLKRGK